MCFGTTTHLRHVTKIQQNEKCCIMSHLFWEFYSKPILSCHDDIITSSFPTKMTKIDPQRELFDMMVFDGAVNV